VRRWKQRHPGAWMEAAGTPAAIGGDDRIEPERRPFEYMLNALRLHEGFALDDFEARTGLPRDRVMPQLLQARQREWLAVSDNRVAPTALGRRFANDVIGLFL
jgi:oxygen-independent coproporphyrinogen-3 oxidase